MDKEDKKKDNTGAIIAITGIGMVIAFVIGFGCGYFLGAMTSVVLTTMFG